MSEINYNINLDYDPENEELAVILNNADNFCNALELADIYFDSIKICIDSPKHYRICKREAPLKITVPIQEDDWDEDDEEEFFDADIFQHASPSRQNELLKMLLKDCQLNGKRLEYTLRKPFDTLIKNHNIKEWSNIAIKTIEEIC